MSDSEISLKYGCNPHQESARVYTQGRSLPFTVLNGNPGYINLLDALNSWQLVKELTLATGLPAATSFKHVSPAGAAVGLPLNDALKRSYFVESAELSPVANAYARARGTDRMSSFGDWIAISGVVDIQTAKIISGAVSDGIIAKGYNAVALKLLSKKKNGAYCVIKMDWDYVPNEIEHREVYGVTFEQRRNDLLITEDVLDNIVTENKEITETAKRDLLIAMITLKYTQSNSVCLVLDGQTIGVGAGQQSRIHCTRLAASKADLWFLRQHPAVSELSFKDGIVTPEKDNLIDEYLRNDVTTTEMENWSRVLTRPPKKLSREEKAEWISKFRNVSLASDAYFPFRDNIDKVRQSGVQYIAQPGGSIRDRSVIDACNRYGMVMAFTGLRLFHH